MQVPHTPPQEEGSIDGAVGVVPKNAQLAQEQAAFARSIKAYLLRPWITVIAPI